MEEEFENNDSLVNNFQDDFKQESQQNTEEDNNLDEEDIFQYTPNLREIAKNDFSKYVNSLNSNSKNEFMNNLNFKYANNINVNEDISGISLLKELEDQWNNIEKQKNINRNKNDESTYSNSKSNNNIDKFKYIVDMVELKKNKFISLVEKNRKERNEDNDIEEYLMGKLNEMEKYKIIDEDLKTKIEIRQQEKNNNIEDNYEEQEQEDNYNGNNNNNYNEDNYENNNINENTFDKKQYLMNLQNNQNKLPELEDLVYETPARTNKLNNNFISLEKNNEKNYYENENEDNVNIGNISRPEKNIMSGKLFDKMKNLYQEINGDNTEIKKDPVLNNKNKNKTNKSGVLGINNLNINDKKYEENIILKNLRNNNNLNINNNENGNINDANKSISLNFNFINKNKYSPNLNFQKYEQNKSNDKRYIQDNILTNIKENNNNIFKDKNRMTLSGLQENFDEILKNVKSSLNNKNINRNNLNLFNNQNNNEDFEEKEEFDKYFEELSNEAKSNLQKIKNISPKKNNRKENKILKKIEENSLLLNDYVNEMNQNKNKFKQKIFELNNNLNNLRNNNNNTNDYNDYSNINQHQRNIYEYNIFPNNNY